MDSIGSCSCVILYWLQSEIPQIRYYMSINLNVEPGDIEYTGEKNVSSDFFLKRAQSMD